jgi:Family of unknown function (DUF6152)
MKTKFALLVATFAVLAASVPMIAHHSFAAEFDGNKGIKLTGTVTKVEWMNPHTYFYIDVTEICEGTPPAGRGGAAGGGAAPEPTAWKCAPADKAKVPNWGLEMGSPNGLMRQGWTRNSLKVGNVVTVEGSRAKDGSNVGNARSVMIDGKRLFAASSQGVNP